MDAITQRRVHIFGTNPYTYDIFSTLQAAHNARKANNIEWINRHEDRLFELLNEFLPHGSGIDCKWTYDFKRADKITARSSYHQMDDNGMYDGWIDFEVSILSNWDIRIKGKFGRNQDTADYLHETIEYSIRQIRALYEVCRSVSYHKDILACVMTHNQAESERATRTA